MRFADLTSRQSPLSLPVTSEHSPFEEEFVSIPSRSRVTFVADFDDVFVQPSTSSLSFQLEDTCIPTSP